MNNRLIKTIILAVQLIVVTFIVSICLEAFLSLNSWKESLKYSETAIRCIALIVFSVVYYMFMSSDSGPDSLFIPFFLLFFTISETRIFETYTNNFSLIIIEPMTATIVFLFSVFAMMTSLIGYGLYYSNRDFASVSWFQAITIFLSLIFAILLPKVPDYYQVIAILPIKTFINTLSGIAFLIIALQLINDKDRNDRIRHLAVIFLILGSFLNVLYDSVIMNIVATVFLVIGLVIITLIVKLNEVKF